jgi:hypothetical protein
MNMSIPTPEEAAHHTLTAILDDGVLSCSWTQAVEMVAKKIRDAYEAGRNDGRIEVKGDFNILM